MLNTPGIHFVLHGDEVVYVGSTAFVRTTVDTSATVVAVSSIYVYSCELQNISLRNRRQQIP
ncbi:hypothetical protein LCGC14_2073040 [marine sediment metagenome]|uniref:Uncharacterized protein n=1 Tax=marine sediment metagenome TaxID=412755 RepID=A0A0F9HEW0_9ZZZZ